MAIPVAAIRTAIAEVMEGDLGSIRPASGTFERGAFDGQPDEAKLAKLRQTSTATHWFDVVVGTEDDHESAPISTRSGHTRRVTVPITIEIWTGLATEIQESDRSTLLGYIKSDGEQACQALGSTGALTETVAGTATGIVSGVMRDADHMSVAGFEIVEENWARRFVHSRISGAVIVAEAA